jgi:hypothetical protein
MKNKTMGTEREETETGGTCFLLLYSFFRPSLGLFHQLPPAERNGRKQEGNSDSSESISCFLFIFSLVRKLVLS